VTGNGRNGATTPVEAPTERRNRNSRDLDVLSTLELLRRINAEDALVPAAVERALPCLAGVVDVAVDALRSGGTVHYFGAGTSGRMATMDAAELIPTFDLEPGRVVAHPAGGAQMLDTAVEGVEDDAASGRAAAAGLGRGDLAIGLTASGRTPFVAGALDAARSARACTVLVSANPQAEIARIADIHVCVETGPEVLTGSTRMKAGTAQKLVLTAFSTAVMVRLGRTYSNLMTNVVAKNDKLHGRMLAILAEATGADLDSCRRALHESEGDLKLALVGLLGQVDPARAQAALEVGDGVVRAALQHLDGAPGGMQE
jgi:N-acetylmuramic acid 6-phosphate etherase